MSAPKAPNRLRRLGSMSKTGLGPRPKPVQRTPATRKHTCCDDPKVEDDGDGHLVCRNCFTQVSESNIVADVTFQEDSRGAATVQGGFVAENARHARTLGSAAYRRIGGGEKNTMQEIESNGRRALGALCPRLGIPETISNQAVQLFILASQHNFSAGRRNDEVVAACLYAACRRQKDNVVLLIDIAELLRLNVFRLGEVYKDLCMDLFLGEGGGGSGVGTQYLVEVESLIMKYCRRLEFGDATRQVAEDAAKIVRRMKRDWMVTGRHPAGLCGACIILAARMNNFRRSVREVVYVSKVADATIHKRVEEFRRTQSAALTVDQFRQYGVRLKHQHDPPSLYLNQITKEKFEEKKRKRQAASEARDLIEISDNGSTAPSRETSATVAPEGETEEERPHTRQRTSVEQLATPAPTQQELRRDADGFVIPALPVDVANAAQDEQPAAQGKGSRKGKKRAPEPVEISEEELADEAELEQNINYMLNDDEVVDSRNEIEKAKDEERAKVLAEQQKLVAAEETKSRRLAEGITWWDGKESDSREEVTAEQLEAEFADDPEVMNCKLNPAEQRIKEQIWVSMNEDWLRAQYEKELIDAVAKAAGRSEKGNKKKGKGRYKRKKGRMGDGTTMAEATEPIETPADASRLMLKKRAPANFSKFINYKALEKVYDTNSSTTSQSRSRSRLGSETPSAGAASGDQTAATDPGEGQAYRDPEIPSSPTQDQPTSAVAGGSAPATTAALATATPEAADEAGPGADDDDDEGGEGDSVQDDALDYGSDAGSDAGWLRSGDDDREDIGEEDFRRAIDPTSRISFDDTFGEDDEYV